MSIDLDLDRLDRCGFPEVVFGEGKTPAAVADAVCRLRDAGQDVLVTRVSPEQVDASLAAEPSLVHNATARTLRLDLSDAATVGRVAVVTAGTGDLPVAEEALETLRWMRVEVSLVVDVGVAGPRRVLKHVEDLQACDVIVCVAGMEGALPSVLGGWVPCPVIAVPTSVGYGASLGGVAALLGMLNSCAANVSVVNIDGGFKGGHVAGLIARRAGRDTSGA